MSEIKIIDWEKTESWKIKMNKSLIIIIVNVESKELERFTNFNPKHIENQTHIINNKALVHW